MGRSAGDAPDWANLATAAIRIQLARKSMIVAVVGTPEQRVLSPAAGDTTGFTSFA